MDALPAEVCIATHLAITAVANDSHDVYLRHKRHWKPGDILAGIANNLGNKVKQSCFI